MNFNFQFIFGSENNQNIDSGMANFSKIDILDETIQHIINSYLPTVVQYISTIKPATETIEKVKYNEIDRDLADAIMRGIDKRNLMEQLIDSGSHYDIEKLRAIVLDIYNRNKSKYLNMNEIILNTIEGLYANVLKKEQNTMFSIFVIIGYFFEICDVGEQPK